MWSTLDKGDTSTLAVCLRDVVALSTLPALWSEAEPLRIAESLAAALSTTLSAQLVYVAVSDGEGRPFIAVAQTDRYETSHFIAEKVGPTLLEWARTRDPDELLMLADPLGRGQLRVATRPLGHHARVKNTLAVIQSIAQKTAQHARTPSEFVTSFNGRLHSLARVHTQLSEANWQRADLHDLIQDQLLQNGSDESGLTSSGPKVELDPQVATHLGMVLHELNTNARKYGAFSSPTGKVMVSWIVTDALLRLTWTEKGGPPVETPITRGFGTSLITQTTAAYGGSAQMHCTSEGVTWEICWPISSSARERPPISASDD